jgi:hypothetical protein
MENIIEPTNSFDFTNLSLTHPVGIQGGAYFTRIEYNKKPLYIQTVKSVTRQGFVKTGKKYYCDLMFDKNSEILIQWFENLEEKCRKLIFEKKDSWFQGNLEENDIESAFNSIIRIYKSGKFYLVRTNIKNTKDDKPAIKIYNEQEAQLEMNDINPETNVVSILEIQGIKFTTRNFQIEINLKQVMVLENEPIFENCLIKKNKTGKMDPSSLTETVLQNTSNNEIENSVEVVNDLELLALDSLISESAEPLVKEDHSEPEGLEELEPFDLDSIPDEEVKDSNKESSITLEFENLSDDIQEDSNELKEVDNTDLNLDKNDSELILKKPNQVYFELYKEARNKAKQAKKNAILAYLEAKNIKKTYMLETINDSDSDFDAEIDEVSESELENL